MSATHLCPSPDCRVELPFERFACPAHWRRMPGDLKRRLNAAWRSGDASAYMAVHEEATVWLGVHT